jgi:lysophospholipase L1-like esterase
MVFLRFKKLIAALKAKASSGDYIRSSSARTYSSTDGSNPKRIMVFGDSNSFRPGGNKTCWPVLLKDKDPSRFTVFNESYDGRTTRYDIGEFNGLSVIASKLTVHAPLDYVIVMLGTNDVKSKYGPPSATEIAYGVRSILDVINTQGGGAKVILVMPPPLGNVTSGELTGAQRRIPLLVAEYRLLATNCNVPLVGVNAIIDSSTDLEPDKVHLNQMGRQKVADAVWTSLQGLTALVMFAKSDTCVGKNIAP